jgi:hypothetical protein
MAKKASKKKKISKRPHPRPLPKRKARLEKGATKRKKMADKPKPWPYQAAEARDRSAEEAQVIVNQAEDALERTNDPMILRALGKVLQSANTILRMMEGQGAKTRPK